MLGTNIQFGRVREEDRFYIPVKARKNQNQKQQQQHHHHHHHHQQLQKQVAAEAKNDEKESISLNTEYLNSTASEQSLVSISNLDRFLKSTTPSVPAQYFSKTTMRGWRTCDIEFQAYFTLGDLWESFKEWSVYGAGVPLVLDGSDCVVQYYVPYLSGIQLYGESTQSTAKSRIGSLSISDENSTMQEGFSSDDSETGSCRGSLLFEYLEQDTPYSREPLADKISDLAHRYPGVKTLRSCDLLPISWISVAWYPIYRIPTGPTLKDLDACFLTYHSVSTPMRGCGSNQVPVVVYPSEIDDVPKLSLPIFGMASYKFKGSMWMQNGVNEHQLANSLMRAAENWLRLVHVNHPDFQFFASHGMYNR